jgi:hypothetical protein
MAIVLRSFYSRQFMGEIAVGQCLPVGVADAARTGGPPMLMAVEEMIFVTAWALPDSHPV